MQAALFPCNYTGYDSNKGICLLPLYSFVLHNSYNKCSDLICMVESIDDSRLKVTLSINRPNVRAKVICEYMYCMHAGNVSDQRKVISY